MASKVHFCPHTICLQSPLSPSFTPVFSHPTNTGGPTVSQELGRGWGYERAQRTPESSLLPGHTQGPAWERRGRREAVSEQSRRESVPAGGHVRSQGAGPPRGCADKPRIRGAAWGGASGLNCMGRVLCPREDSAWVCRGPTRRP